MASDSNEQNMSEIESIIKEIEESLSTDFMTDATRDIMTRAVDNLKKALEEILLSSNLELHKVIQNMSQELKKKGEPQITYFI